MTLKLLVSFPSSLSGSASTQSIRSATYRSWPWPGALRCNEQGRHRFGCGLWSSETQLSQCWLPLYLVKCLVEYDETVGAGRLYRCNVGSYLFCAQSHDSCNHRCIFDKQELSRMPSGCYSTPSTTNFIACLHLL